MPNLAALSNITTAATALSNLVLISPQETVGIQPINFPNADGSVNEAEPPEAFLFHIEADQDISVESDITDHYVEDNTAREDQISLKPENYRVRGFIGELNDIFPEIFGFNFKTLADRLTVINTYAPQVSQTASIAAAQALTLYQLGANIANTAVSTWGALGSGSGQAVIGSGGLISAGKAQNKQQVAFQKLYGHWRERRLFNVQTPWAVFQNMAIQRIKVSQDEETRMITDIEITFKMIRTAKTSTDSISNIISMMQQRAGLQASPEVNNGTSSPAESGESLTGSIASMQSGG